MWQGNIVQDLRGRALRGRALRRGAIGGIGISGNHVFSDCIFFKSNLEMVCAGNMKKIGVGVIMVVIPFVCLIWSFYPSTSDGSLQ